jgi:hypothetical protein
LLLNYDVTHNNISNTLGSGPGFSTNDASKVYGKDAVVTYQKKFKEAAKSWNLNSITTTMNDFQLNPVGSSTSTLDNSSNQNLYNKS